MKCREKLAEIRNLSVLKKLEYTTVVKLRAGRSELPNLTEYQKAFLFRISLIQDFINLMGDYDEVLDNIRTHSLSLDQEYQDFKG